MNFSPLSRSKSRNSFVALLLPPMLHNFSALKSVNPLDGITYGPNSEKSRKSNAALLLPHLFLVSPLLRYSCKKMGGVGGSAVSPPMNSIGMPLLLRPDGLHRDPLSAKAFPVPIRNSQCFLSLTKILEQAPKTPQCFLSLTDHRSRKYQSFLSLTKKAGEGYPLIAFFPDAQLQRGASRASQARKEQLVS
jgi:hypothetical protein